MKLLLLIPFMMIFFQNTTGFREDYQTMKLFRKNCRVLKNSQFWNGANPRFLSKYHCPKPIKTPESSVSARKISREISRARSGRVLQMDCNGEKKRIDVEINVIGALIDFNWSLKSGENKTLLSGESSDVQRDTNDGWLHSQGSACIDMSQCLEFVFEGQEDSGTILWQYIKVDGEIIMAGTNTNTKAKIGKGCCTHPKQLVQVSIPFSYYHYENTGKKFPQFSWKIFNGSKNEAIVEGKNKYWGDKCIDLWECFNFALMSKDTSSFTPIEHFIMVDSETLKHGYNPTVQYMIGEQCCTELNEKNVQLYMELDQNPLDLNWAIRENSQSIVIGGNENDFEEAEDNNWISTQQVRCIDLSKCLGFYVESSGNNGTLVNGKYIISTDGRSWSNTWVGATQDKFGQCPSQECPINTVQISVSVLGEGTWKLYQSNGTVVGKDGENYLHDGNWRNVSYCIDPVECYTLYTEDEGIEFIFDGLLKVSKRHGTLSAGSKCCESKPLLAPMDGVYSQSSHSRTENIVEVISAVSGMDALADTNSAQYQAACWLIYEDPLHLSAFHTSLVQRYVLATFYYATGGVHWNDQYSFLSPKHECEWKDEDEYSGVNCNSKRITSLSLEENNLTGNVISELAKLSNLGTLDLSENFMQGTLPGGIFDLKNLAKLVLGYNRLSGVVPSNLGKLQKLKYLELDNNEFGGSLPKELFGLENLEALHVQGNNLTGTLPTEISKLKKVEVIDISHNVFIGTIPGTIFDLVHLHYLDVAYNNITGLIPTEIGRASELFHLNLNSNLLKGTLPLQLKNLKALVILKLSHNEFYGTIPHEIKSLTNLRTLDLSHNVFAGTLPLFSNNFTLDELHIEKNEIYDNISDEICENFDGIRSFSADCAAHFFPPRVKCHCCTQCYGEYSSYSRTGPCPGGELEISFQNFEGPSYNDVDCFYLKIIFESVWKDVEPGNNYFDASFSLKDDTDTTVLSDGPFGCNPPNVRTHKTCISRTSSFSFNFLEGSFVRKGYWKEQPLSYEIFFDGELLAKGNQPKIEFGYSSETKSLAVNKNDTIEVCGQHASVGDR